MSSNCVDLTKYLLDIQKEISNLKDKRNSTLKNITINGNLNINGNESNKNKKYNLGSENKKFKELYLSGNSIYLGKI